MYNYKYKYTYNMGNASDVFRVSPDPCTIIPITIGIVCVIMLYVGIHMIPNKIAVKGVSISCFSAIDYIKFTLLCTMLFYYYETVIKTNSPVCGNDGIAMWGSLIALVILCTGLLVGVCYLGRYSNLMSTVVGYILMLAISLPCTLYTLKRLHDSKGFTSEFWKI